MEVLNQQGNTMYFDTVKGAPINTMFRVNFSRRLTEDELRSVSIRKGMDFIPAEVRVVSDHAYIIPKYELMGDRSYSMSIVLNNGEIYVLPFETEKAYRRGDISPATHRKTPIPYL